MLNSLLTRYILLLTLKHKYLKGLHMDLKAVVQNTKNIYMTDSSLSTLLDFERVLDEVDMYAYKNWINGELVQGPNVEKYWVTCKFSWPYKMMPDPKAGIRLLDYNCKVSFEEDYITYPKKIEGPEDFEPGTRKAKTIKKKVWVVTIRMPSELLNDIRQGFLELENEKIDMTELDQAEQADMGMEDAPMEDMGGDDMGMDELDLDL